MSSATTFKDLIELPSLPTLVKDLQMYLDEERSRRQKFYEWIQEDQKAEFIQGEIVLHSPATNEHTNAVGHLYRSSSIFVDLSAQGKVKTEKAMISLTRNDYEPDLAFWRKEISDTFVPTQTHFPEPDFVVEVLSKSSTRRDRVIKFKDYAEHNITEYWIIDPKKQVVEQYVLPKGKSEYLLWRKLTIHEEIESQVITGFKIPVLAIFDAAANVAALKNLLG